MKSKVFLSFLTLICCCVLGFSSAKAQVHQANYNYNPTDSVGYYSQLTGVISKIAGVYVILPEGQGEGTRYYVKNLDNAFAREGMSVLFSAVRLRIPPNVRMVGTPVYIRSMQELVAGVAPKTQVVKKGRAVKTMPTNTTNSRPTKQTGISPSNTTNQTVAVAPGQTIYEIEGTVKKAGNFFIIDTPDGNRFFPQNLPDNFRYPDVKVLISGQIGEIPPNVRMVGTPLTLSSITRLTPVQPTRRQKSNNWGEWQKLN